jgi:hypothetical protein
MNRNVTMRDAESQPRLRTGRLARSPLHADGGRRRNVCLRPSGSLTAAATLLALQVILLPAARSESEVPALTPDQRAIIEKIGKPARAEGIAYAGAPQDSMGAEVRLPFREGGFITLVKKGTTLLSDGSVSWFGEVKETGERAMLMLWGNALLTGYFAYRGTVFAVESLGGGVHAFAELGRDKQLPDHPPPSVRRDSVGGTSREAAVPQAPPEPSVPPLADAARLALEAKDITIDLMILYTTNVTSRYVRSPDDLLALATQDVNAMLKNSGLANVNVRLVHSEAIEYDTTQDDQFVHLYAMIDGLGPFKGVKKLRNEKHADIVGLIIDNPTGCGLSTRIGPESDEAFFVVHHACATITMSMAHEIGHILGVRHDRFVDESNVPFAYGHGYVNGTKWRDIMSYNQGCGGCPRIPFWSNPRIMYKGEPTGTAAADSARVILELAERVSKFR